MFRKITAALFSVALLAGIGVVGTASPAAADTAVSSAKTTGCVSGYEYNSIYYGESKAATEYTFGTRGWWVWYNNSYALKKYYACGSYYSIVKVKYYWDGYKWAVYSLTRW